MSILISALHIQGKSTGRRSTQCASNTTGICVRVNECVCMYVCVCVCVCVYSYKHIPKYKYIGRLTSGRYLASSSLPSSSPPRNSMRPPKWSSSASAKSRLFTSPSASCESCSTRARRACGWSQVYYIYIYMYPCI